MNQSTSAERNGRLRTGFGPAPDVAALRERPGIVQVPTPFGPSAWLLTRHADVRRMLGDADAFRNGWGPDDLDGLVLDPRQLSGDRSGNLLSLDPPDHTRLRRMLTPEFTVRRMRRLEPRIVEIVDEHLAAMARGGAPADLVAEFALPIPSLVICELLGVPTGDQAEFQERTSRQLDTTLPEAEKAELAAQSLAYMDELVARARRDPGEDLIGMLIRDHDDRLSNAELVGIGNLLLVAGHETTSNMLGLGTLALLRHPEQLALVRDDPESAARAVEELLRWLSVVNAGSPRMATRDVEFEGSTIRRGDLVVFNLPAANRDPELTDDPDRLDITRPAVPHLGFGHGIHHCLGAPLARMEMRIAFPALLRKFPDLRLAVPDEDVAFATHQAIYGLKELPVAWS
ncbi:Cytochrome P450 [Saccharopolyspora kobensis]|uniref:Cytochrome P450 n=1 Tax=Saccharopolyspora kobensis TaxID=146035 RepID=A0A1H5T5X7_9PSEU|nr:cytochrome P450 [Saccharopolyspora kobensis]SEF58196.1 Cytochrome P450 [Saccharopolyspora kobensis]SFC49761.1 Cytochrome P450 [Saccharopolyspora kobensis]